MGKNKNDKEGSAGLELGLERKENTVTLAVLSETAIRERQQFVWPSERSAPVLVMLGDDNDSPICLVIKDNYAELADWSEHPNNNVFLLVIALAMAASLARITGSEDEAIQKHVSGLIQLITKHPVQDSALSEE